MKSIYSNYLEIGLVDWAIVKLVLVLSNQNAQIWEISFGKLVFYEFGQ